MFYHLNAGITNIMILYISIGIIFLKKSMMDIKNRTQYVEYEKFFGCHEKNIYLLCLGCYFFDLLFYRQTGNLSFLLHMIPVLSIQSCSDIKERKVYTYINELFLGMMIVDMLCFAKSFQMESLKVIGILYMFIAFLYYIKGIFGHGDYIIMCGLLFMTQCIGYSEFSPYFGGIYFLIFLIISNAAIWVYGHYYSYKNKINVKEVKLAFYPFMEIGILGLTCYTVFL